MKRIAYESRWRPDDRAWIDGDKSIIAVVIGLAWWGSGLRHMLELSWMHNGALQSAWVDEARLTSADGA